jgi:hypothetical protein
MCVDVVGHFAMNLVIITLDKKYTYLQTIGFFLVMSIWYIDIFLIHNSPWDHVHYHDLEIF